LKKRFSIPRGTHPVIGRFAKTNLRGEELTMTTLLRNLWNDDQGQDLIEYTLLMAFVALASAALFISSGKSISSIWSTTNSSLSTAATTAAS
jgi:Flp pilus assembly pilin Flp